MVTGLFLHCRAGFEGECAAEIQDRAAALGIHGYCKAKADAAYVVFDTPQAGDAQRLHQALPFSSLVFSRQWFVITALCKDLPVGDRVSPLVSALQPMPGPGAALYMETPDTNTGKELSGLGRKLLRPLEEGLRRGKLLAPGAEPRWRIHVCLLSGTAAYVGYAAPLNSAPWPMGVPRLKFPRGAPSRSTLKLEEAFLVFLSGEERDTLLRPGTDAVDLGAAPGGWTWQLVRRHLRVTAVDNGAVDDALLESGLVEHVRGDGFRFHPANPVAWMVCDIVEQPIRIAELAARWLRQGWCRHTVFNLKLPMKKRYQEVQRCLDLVRTQLTAAGITHTVACKQLYHDREEVTVYATLR